MKLGSIYVITNTINGHQYVGQTTQKVTRRFAKHLRSVNDPKRRAYLHNAMNKYGKKNFEVIAVETDIPQENLDTREKYWIKKLDTFHNGYNLTEGGGGSKGHKQTKKTKEKLFQKNVKNAKEVFKFDRNGKLVSGYRSLTEAARLNKINTTSHILECINKKRWTAHGFIWKRTNKPPSALEIKMAQKISTKPVSQYTYAGKMVFKHKSIAAAARKVKTGRSTIAKAVRSKSHKSMGYVWKLS